MTEVVSVSSATVAERDVVVLDAASLTVAAGELVAVVGPSGSGKTTLLNVVLGLQPLAAGAVTALPLTERPGWSDVAFVPQALGLVPELTVADNVRLPLLIARARARGDDDRCDALLDVLGLAHLRSRRATEISLGEQQRAAVARALAADASLVVADEPTAHQDEANASRVAAALAGAAAEGRAVLVATHDAALSARADRVVELHGGRVTG